MVTSNPCKRSAHIGQIIVIRAGAVVIKLNNNIKTYDLYKELARFLQHLKHLKYFIYLFDNLHLDLYLYHEG